MPNDCNPAIFFVLAKGQNHKIRLGFNAMRVDRWIDAAENVWSISIETNTDAYVYLERSRVVHSSQSK